MRIERWSPAEAHAAVASPDLDRMLGVAVDVPAVVVSVDDPARDDLEPLAAALASRPAVAIAAVSGRAPTGSAPSGSWDVVTDTIDTVVEGVLAAPLAAVTTTQVLRRSLERPIDDGLLVESWAYASLQAGPEFEAWLAQRGRRVRPIDHSDRVRVDDHGHRIDVVLTRPRLRNLLDAAMRDQLVDALKAIAAGDERPVVLRADGPAFCAGGDTAEFGTVHDPATAHALRSTANVAPWLHRLAHRTAAHVHGPCVGAGIELAAVCGTVVAGPDARFRLPETRMGLLPGAGGTVSIPRRIGRQRTLEWLLTDQEVDASTALEWGLVDEIDDA